MESLSGIHKYEIRIENPHKCTNIAVSSEETLFFGNNQSRKVFAFDGKTGKLKWENEFKGFITSPVIDKNNNLLYSCTDGKTYSFNGKTGEKLWEIFSGLHTATLSRNPFVCDNGEIMVSSQGKILVVDPITGKTIDEIATGKAVPYFNCKNGNLLTTDYNKISSSILTWGS
jgi:outer membrane protein assembly factor BamB